MPLLILGEVFTYTTATGFTYKWNVAALQRMLKLNNRQPNSVILVADMITLLDNNLATRELEQDIVDKADLSRPVIIAELPPEAHDKNGGRHLTIDGWHRMAKAVKQNKPMPAHVLSFEDSEHFRLNS